MAEKTLDKTRRPAAKKVRAKDPVHRVFAFFGAFLKKIRNTRGMSRKDMAYGAEIDPSYVTLIENRSYLPSKEVVERLANVLEIRPELACLRAGYVPEQWQGLSDYRLEQLCKHVEGLLAEEPPANVA